jgi:hypothetical protein
MQRKQVESLDLNLPVSIHMKVDLNRQVASVTHAARGLGQAIADLREQSLGVDGGWSAGGSLRDF